MKNKDFNPKDLKLKKYPTFFDLKTLGCFY